MSLPKFSVKRPITTIMAVLVVIVLGFVSFNELSIDLLPNINVPVAVVMTQYPNAGPEEVEKFVTKPIEQSIGSVEGIKTINSTSSNGMSIVVAQFNWGTDMDQATLHIRDKVDMVSMMLPDDANKPAISKIDPNAMAAMNIGITSDKELSDLQKFVEDNIQPNIEKLDGVGSVSISGGLEDEIQVNIDSQKLEGYGLTISSISGILSAENLNLPAGTVKKGNKELVVKTKGEFESLEDVENIQIPLTTGGIVRLKDIADIGMVNKKVTQISNLNGNRCLGITVQKQSDANTVQVSKNVNEEIKKLQEKYPDIKIQIIQDGAEYINQAISNVGSVAVQGGILAIIILLLFLRDWRSTLIIALSIPISIIATFVILYFSHITINLMTLGGLALGIGMLVDCSIVVLENIYRFIQEGYLPHNSAVKGAQEVAMAVTASTLTTVAVFFPVAFMSGITSELFKDLALTVAFSLFASLIVSLTLVPMMSSKILNSNKIKKLFFKNENKDVHNKNSNINDVDKFENKNAIINNDFNNDNIQNEFNAKNDFKNDVAKNEFNVENNFNADKFNDKADRSRIKNPFVKIIKKLGDKFENGFESLKQRYIKILSYCLDHRKKVILIIVGIFIASMASLVTVGGEFFPTFDTGEFYVSIELPEGAQLKDTQNISKVIQEKLEKIKEVDTIYSQIGSSVGMTLNSSENNATINVKLKSINERTRKTSDVIDELRNDIKNIAGAHITAQSTGAIAFSTAPVTIKLEGDDLDTLNKLSEEIKDKISTVDGVRQVETSFGQGKPEVIVKVNRQNAARYGLTGASISQQVNAIVSGMTSTKYRVNGNEIDIVVKGDDIYGESITNLGNVMIKNTMGMKVPLNLVADLDIQNRPAQIERENKSRLCTITCQIYGRSLKEINEDVVKKLDSIDMPAGYNYKMGGDIQNMTESFSQLGKAILLSVVLIYMIMAAQFESLLDPFIIMFSIPLAFSGGALGLFITRRSVSVPALIGILVLCGIVVNNAIVLVDYINARRKMGENRRQAIMTAGPTRIRPIFMTTATTVLGLIPMAIGIGMGGEFQAPMATVIVGGLLFSTILTLIFIPVLYTVFDDLRGVFHKTRRQK